MQNLDFITPPWYLESLELEPVPPYEAVGLQFSALVLFEGDTFEGRRVVGTTTEKIMYGYLEGKKLYITVELPVTEDGDGRRNTVHPGWFPHRGLFF